MRRLIPLLLVSVVLAQPAYAKQPMSDEETASGTNGQSSHPGKTKALPPGLQKKLERGGELPPGWQMKLQRGEVLDPDLAKHAKPAGKEVTDKLPKSTPDSEDLVLEDRVVRVMKDSRRIVDIFTQPQ